MYTVIISYLLPRVDVVKMYIYIYILKFLKRTYKKGLKHEMYIYILKCANTLTPCFYCKFALSDILKSIFVSFSARTDIIY